MFFTFSKSDNTPTIPSRPHNATACYHCRGRKVNCSKEQPSCRKCTSTGQPCYYPTANSPFRCKPAQGPGGGPIPIPTRSAKKGLGLGLSDAPTTPLASTTPVYSGFTPPYQDLSFVPIDYGSETTTPEELQRTVQQEALFLPSPSSQSPKTQSLFEYNVQLSSRTASEASTSQGCRCGDLIEQQLAAVPGEHETALSMLSAAMDSIQVIAEVGRCPGCLSCRKSVMLLLVLAEKLAEHLQGLVHHRDWATNDAVTCAVSMGAHEVKFTDDFTLVYGGLLHLHLRRLLTILDRLGQSILEAGWSMQLGVLSGVCKRLREMGQSMNLASMFATPLASF